MSKNNEYRIRQYDLVQGALEIQYIEEFFGEFDRRKTATEIMARLNGRAHSILMAEAPLPDEPGHLVPVSYKVMHEIRPDEVAPKLRDLVARLREAVHFGARRVLYSWIGGTRRDWRGQGHFRALTEEQEAWGVMNGFHELVVKTKNRFHEMRGTLARLGFNVIKFEPHPTDSRESKIYLSKLLGPGVLEEHRKRRTVLRA